MSCFRFSAMKLTTDGFPYSVVASWQIRQTAVGRSGIVSSRNLKAHHWLFPVLGCCVAANLFKNNTGTVFSEIRCINQRQHLILLPAFVLWSPSLSP